MIKDCGCNTDWFPNGCFQEECPRHELGGIKIERKPKKSFWGRLVNFFWGCK